MKTVLVLRFGRHAKEGMTLRVLSAQIRCHLATHASWKDEGGRRSARADVDVVSLEDWTSTGPGDHEAVQVWLRSSHSSMLNCRRLSLLCFLDKPSNHGPTSPVRCDGPEDQGADAPPMRT
jgi:hypothetical protein